MNFYEWCVIFGHTVYSSIPIAHSVKAKETYESVKRFFQLISYEQHKWIVCVDWKMVCFLLGQQLGYTRYSCFFVFKIAGRKSNIGKKGLAKKRSNGIRTR